MTTKLVVVMVAVFLGIGIAFAGDEYNANTNIFISPSAENAIGGGPSNITESIINNDGLEVINVASNGDKKPPVVNSLKIEPGTIDSTDSDQELTLTVAIEDVSGVCVSGNCGDYNGSPTQLALKNIDSDQVATFYEFKLVFGDSNDGIYSSKVTIKKGSAAGIWRVDNMLVVDKLGNYKSLVYEDFKKQK
ncbi:MAG: hypothetical protein Q8L10_02270 [Candidatus Moranbacteria bacterium]|nr:hypothetical protein [Candidatus Moranbacteria bacterium]